MRNSVFLLSTLALSATLLGCADPKPPRESHVIPPEVMARRIMALDQEKKRDEAIAYQYAVERERQEALRHQAQADQDREENSESRKGQDPSARCHARHPAAVFVFPN